MESNISSSAPTPDMQFLSRAVEELNISDEQLHNICAQLRSLKDRLLGEPPTVADGTNCSSPTSYGGTLGDFERAFLRHKETIVELQRLVQKLDSVL